MSIDPWTTPIKSYWLATFYLTKTSRKARSVSVNDGISLSQIWNTPTMICRLISSNATVVCNYPAKLKSFTLIYSSREVCSRRLFERHFIHLHFLTRPQLVSRVFSPSTWLRLEDPCNLVLEPRCMIWIIWWGQDFKLKEKELFDPSVRFIYRTVYRVA